MTYSIKGLETSRNEGFQPKNVFGILLKEFLNLKDGMKILDIGCGTGFFTRIIAEQINADITGMDISNTLLKGAKEIAKKQNLDINFVNGNIKNIDCSDNTFDIVMCDIMLECFNDITVPLKEMKRVCKPNGKIVAIEPFYQSGFEYYPELDNEMRDLVIKFSRADRAFGVGPMLPNLFYKIGLKDIDLVGWFWGKIGYEQSKTMAINEKIKDMEDNLDNIKRYIFKSKELTLDEINKIINFYEERLQSFKEDSSLFKNDMSVRGLPVFIVKGTKIN